MADLTLAQVAAKLPAGALVADAPNNDVKLSLKALMNEASVTLTDPKVGEFLAKLIDGATLAQIDYNADEGNTLKIRSYPTPTLGTPLRDETSGVFFVNFTYNVQVAAPLDRDQFEAIQI